VIALDTNILVHAHRAESPNHETALALVQGLLAGGRPWVLPWPCVYEFVRVVTHPRIFVPPTRPKIAVEFAQALIGSERCVLLGESPRHAESFGREILRSGCTGNLVFDAHIAALMKDHGVDEIITADRDFHRFAGLRITNPFATV